MWCLILVLFLSSDAHAQRTLSTDLYEQEKEEPKTKSFTSKVRVVREISDEVEVFFESNEATGAYTLPRSLPSFGKMLQDLEKSRKPQGPMVSVTADEDKRIKSVEVLKSTPVDPKRPWMMGQ